MTAVTVVEPATYTPLGRHSFFADLADASVRGDVEAKERLARHSRETEADQRVAHAADEARLAAAVGYVQGTGYDVEFRTNPNSTAGTGGEFIPPAWLIDRFASASRAGRPLGDLLNPIPLPPGVNQVNIPRMTTASITGVQTDAQSVASQDLVTVAVTAPVITVAGQFDVSQQLFDQSPGGFDGPAFIDLNRAYNRNLEIQLLSGTGTGNQALGLLNVTGGTTVAGATFTTIALFWPGIGQAAAGVGNNRLLRPEIALMAPRRWDWIAFSVDSSNRPITSPHSEVHSSDLMPAGGEDPVGSVGGIPVWTDGAITAGAVADQVIFCRPSDMLLFEGSPRYMATVTPLSGTLQVRLSLHRYVCFIPHRYPTGIGVVTGLTQPANY